MKQVVGVALEIFVQRLKARSQLTDDEADAVRGLKGQARTYASGADIVELGERLENACLVMSGLVGRFGQNSDGVRQITCLYIPGDMADLPSVVSPKAGWALGTLAKTTILRVPHADLRRVAADYPGLAEAFWRDCAADGSIFSEWVVNVGRRHALPRLAHLFCEMAIRCEQAGLGDRHSFPLPITQWDLGDATGMTNVHVNRTLRELRTQSILELRRGIVTVHDWEGLVSLGDFDDGFLLLDGPWPRIAERA